MGRWGVGRLALAATICAGAFATGCEPAPTEGWRSELVTLNGAGTAGPNRLTTSYDLSPDGRKVLFTTPATDMGFPDSTNDGVGGSAYIRDLTTGVTTRVNSTPDGTDGGNGNVTQVSFAQGGTSVVFATTDSNLGPIDTNGAFDLYLHDLTTAETRLLTTDATGATSANGASVAPTVSDDGRMVAFKTSASDLGPTDTNAADDVYVIDLQTGTTELLTVTLSGAAAGFSNQFLSPTFSSDGTKVTFLSSAPDIVSPSTSGTHAYVRDLVTDTTILASVGTDAAGLPPGDAGAVVIDPTGTQVAVQHRATGQATNRQIYVRDLSAQTTTLVSRSGQSLGNATSVGPVFSPDGTRLAFTSQASNLAPGDTNGVNDVFVYDIASGQLDLVSYDTTGAPSNRASSGQRFSPDGSKLAFVSAGANIVHGFSAISSDLYLRDLASGSIELVSLDAAGTAGGNFTLGSTSFAPDGRSILFTSSSSTLDGRPVVPGFASLFVARLTPFADADLGVTAAMAETPPAGQAWAIELTVTNDGPEDAGVVRFAYFFTYLGAGHTVTTDHGTCTMTQSGPGDTTVACTMPDLAAGAAATIVVSGQYPLGGLTADTVGAVSGVRIADPVSANNTVSFHVSGP